MRSSSRAASLRQSRRSSRSCKPRRSNRDYADDRDAPPSEAVAPSLVLFSSYPWGRCERVVKVVAGHRIVTPLGASGARVWVAGKTPAGVVSLATPRQNKSQQEVVKQ